MPLPKHYYPSYAEFARDELRGNYKVGYTMQDMVYEASFDRELNFDPDRDPFEINNNDDEDDY